MTVIPPLKHPVHVGSGPVRYDLWPGSEATRDEVEQYIELGIAPEERDLVGAIIINDLFETFRMADHFHQSRILAIVKWFYTHAPSDCRGSKARVALWCAHRVKLLRENE